MVDISHDRIVYQIGVTLLVYQIGVTLRLAERLSRLGSLAVLQPSFRGLGRKGDRLPIRYFR